VFGPGLFHEDDPLFVDEMLAGVQVIESVLIGLGSIPED